MKRALRTLLASGEITWVSIAIRWMKSTHLTGSDREGMNATAITIAARHNLQDCPHGKTESWDRFVFLQSFKRTFSWHVAHHLPSSFTAPSRLLLPHMGRGGSAIWDPLYSRNWNSNPRRSSHDISSMPFHLETFFFLEKINRKMKGHGLCRKHLPNLMLHLVDDGQKAFAYGIVLRQRSKLAFLSSKQVNINTPHQKKKKL